MQIIDQETGEVTDVENAPSRNTFPPKASDEAPKTDAFTLRLVRFARRAQLVIWGIALIATIALLIAQPALVLATAAIAVVVHHYNKPRA